jgi:DNA-binding winged helix-turn-helix (wHTH) protein/TolB-like protein
MSPDSAGRVYEFGPFRYDAGQRLLFREGTLVPLVPKVVDTLHVLLEARGRIVDKADLMRLVWPDTTVEEVGLARNVSLLRKALNDDSGERYIETVPKRGYRFKAEVREAADTEPIATSRFRPNWKWFAAPAITIAFAALIQWQFYTPSRVFQHRSGDPAVAVVPFRCLTSGSDCAVFSDALDEQLVADLSKRDWLQVVSPSTVKRHQKIGNSMGLMGRLLGLDALLEGSIQRLPAGFRVTAELVEVHTGRLIWADTYDCSGADSAQTQINAARRIGSMVGAHLAINQPFRARERFLQENRKESEGRNSPDAGHSGPATSFAERKQQ